jgi:hypothetical protein
MPAVFKAASLLLSLLQLAPIVMLSLRLRPPKDSLAPPEVRPKRQGAASSTSRTGILHTTNHFPADQRTKEVHR